MAASAGSGPGEPEVGTNVGEPPALSPEEIARRLQSTRRELSNRRKILLRNLPAESSSQVGGEVAEAAAGQRKARSSGGGERRRAKLGAGGVVGTVTEISGNNLVPPEVQLH